eukprot:9815704-Alexandrium_andersonii.AAC.1
MGPLPHGIITLRSQLAVEPPFGLSAFRPGDLPIGGSTQDGPLGSWSAFTMAPPDWFPPWVQAA